jgi:hypothetical protein
LNDAIAANFRADGPATLRWVQLAPSKNHVSLAAGGVAPPNRSTLAPGPPSAKPELPLELVEPPLAELPPLVPLEEPPLLDVPPLPELLDAVPPSAREPEEPGFSDDDEPHAAAQTPAINPTHRARFMIPSPY